MATAGHKRAGWTGVHAFGISCVKQRAGGLWALMYGGGDVMACRSKC
ncbi:MAG: hypothetical protein INR71_15540 [Terriglobus roseus]|nr:hypothetical protein [Terriglobus roseus]